MTKTDLETARDPDTSGPVRSESARDLLALATLPGVGPMAVARALERFGGAGAAMDAGARALAPVLELSAQSLVSGGYSDAARARANEVMERCRADGLGLVTVEMAGYPERLRQLHDPPPFLFLRGDAALMGRPAVAVVGSRRSTAYGRRTTEALAGALARASVVVVSGMALGIDGAAHRGCLEAGGDTIAVLGSGPDVLSPYSHRALGLEIARRGLLVTEFLPGVGARAHHFPRRNRILAALADAVVVVEAARRSGAMITVGHALDLGRDVFAVPGPVGRASSEGTNALLRDGAGVITSVEEFVEGFASQSALAGRESRAEPTDVGTEALEVWRLLAEGPSHVDHLARRARLTTDKTLASLAELELVGLAVRDAGMRFRRSP